MAASWITGQGVSSRSSHSAAAGRTTPSAKPCTQSRMSCWSWFSSSVNSGPSGPGAVAGRLRHELLRLRHRRRIAHATNITRNGVVVNAGRLRCEIAQVERPQPLGAAVGAVEEAPVDAAVLVTEPW